MKPGDLMAVLDNAGEGRILRMEEAEHVGAREVRTVPIGDRGKLCADRSRWSRKTGLPVAGGPGRVREATSREVAVNVATRALEKAKCKHSQAERLWAGWANEVEIARTRLVRAERELAAAGASAQTHAAELAAAEAALAAAQAGDA